MFKNEFYQIIDKERIYKILSGCPTPCYLYFSDIIDRNIRRLREAVYPFFEVYYAVKANPQPEIISYLAQKDLGFDVASAGEIQLILNAGANPDKTEFSGPGKTAEELEFAIDHDIGSINAESLEELEIIALLCRKKNSRCDVGIRLNIGTSKLRSPLRMGGITQFGIPLEQAEKALKFIEENANLNFTGLHVHSGSQILDAESLLDNYEMIIHIALDLEKASGMKCKKVNLGGGLGIKYFPKQEELNLVTLSEGLQEIFSEDIYREFAERIRLIIEPGRFLVGESGLYVTRILYRKSIEDKEFAIVDGGLHHNYLLAGGMGQIVRRNFELDIIPAQKSAPLTSSPTIVDIAGCLCTPQDVLATDYENSFNPTPGDYMIFFNCGAYGLSASPSHFLSHPPPAQFLI